MAETLTLLGSTGSIGTQVLDVVRNFPQRFRIRTLAAGKNLDRLVAQVREFQPEAISIASPDDIPALRERLPEYAGRVFAGREGLNALAQWDGVDTVVVGLVGLTGLEPSLSALRAGRRLLTANKETFVAGGHLIQPHLDRIVPIDSEHVAVHQCVRQAPEQSIRAVWLTASGGPFRTFTREALEAVTPEAALKHPNWVMGERITIDSATMMNKGLEIIEARWLFGLDYDRIRVVVHPESIIHGGVEFVDGSIVVQMGAPDMHGPIQYAMTWPERCVNPETSVYLDLLQLSRLNLEPPDLARFPCVRLAYEAGRMGSSATAVLNGADEVAVQLFLTRQLAFMDIPRVLEAVLAAHADQGADAFPDLETIQAVDAWARQATREQAERLIGRVPPSPVSASSL